MFLPIALACFTRHVPRVRRDASHTSLRCHEPTLHHSTSFIRQRCASRPVAHLARRSRLRSRKSSYTWAARSHPARDHPSILARRVRLWERRKRLLLTRLRVDLTGTELLWRQVTVPRQANRDCGARASLHGLLSAAAVTVKNMAWVALEHNQLPKMGRAFLTWSIMKGSVTPARAPTKARSGDVDGQSILPPPAPERERSRSIVRVREVSPP
jgi:hypothetical protein